MARGPGKKWLHSDGNLPHITLHWVQVMQNLCIGFHKICGVVAHGLRKKSFHFGCNSDHFMLGSGVQLVGLSHTGMTSDNMQASGFQIKRITSIRP